MWFRVDDKLWGSPKWTSLKAGPRALWVTAGAYSMDQLTDGFIPTHVLPILGGREVDAVALVKADLWEQDAGGFRFHDWSDWQPSREDVLGKRETEAARKAKWRAEKAERAAKRAASEPGPDDVPDMSQWDNDVSPAGVPDVSRSSRPDPTRPDPTAPKGAPMKSTAARRGTRITEDFVVTPEMSAWADTTVPGINVTWETRKFINYWMAVPGAKGTKLDWPRTWQNWMLRQAEESSPRSTGTTTINHNQWMTR